VSLSPTMFQIPSIQTEDGERFWCNTSTILYKINSTLTNKLIFSTLFKIWNASSDQWPFVLSFNLKCLCC
jgi:hypothetical protein